MQSSAILTIDESDIIWAVMNHVDELGEGANEINGWLAAASDEAKALVIEAVAQDVRDWLTDHRWREIEDVIVENVRETCTLATALKAVVFQA